MSDLDAGFVEQLSENGYEFIRQTTSSGIVALNRRRYRPAIMVGISANAYLGRYCYDNGAEAIEALLAWDGNGDPPGNWEHFIATTAEKRLNPLYEKE